MLCAATHRSFVGFDTPHLVGDCAVHGERSAEKRQVPTTQHNTQHTEVTQRYHQATMHKASMCNPSTSQTRHPCNIVASTPPLNPQNPSAHSSAFGCSPRRSLQQLPQYGSVSEVSAFRSCRRPLHTPYSDSDANTNQT